MTANSLPGRDILLEEDGRVFPVEIKLSATVGRRDIAGIDALKKSGIELGHGAVVCLTEKHYPISSDVDAIPVSSIR